MAYSWKNLKKISTIYIFNLKKLMLGGGNCDFRVILTFTGLE